MKNKKISKLSDHDKLINLIAVQGDKDVNHLLQSIGSPLGQEVMFIRYNDM